MQWIECILAKHEILDSLTNPRHWVAFLEIEPRLLDSQNILYTIRQRLPLSQTRIPFFWPNHNLLFLELFV